MVTIEWLVEILECPDGDIFEVSHCDSYAEALQRAADLCETHGLPHYQIGLVRDRGDNDEGLVDRQWAYIGKDGKLPTRFDWGGGEDGGAMVPAKYHKELLK